MDKRNFTLRKAGSDFADALTAPQLSVTNAQMSSEASHIHWVGARFQARLAALVGRPLFWFLFVALGLAIPITRAVKVALPKPLPILSKRGVLWHAPVGR